MHAFLLRLLVFCFVQNHSFFLTCGLDVENARKIGKVGKLSDESNQTDRWIRFHRCSVPAELSLIDRDSPYFDPTPKKVGGGGGGESSSGAHVSIS